MPPRDWQATIEDFTRVQKLVHLSVRMQPEDAPGIQNEIFKQKRLAYEDELASQAAAVGCAGRKGVTSPVLLSAMMEEARTESLGIISTYNYDLAISIRNIRQETPTANRNVYAKRINEWEEARNEWKSKQIMLWNTVSWQDRAVKDFLENNPQLAEKGYAIVEPQRTAVCDVCREWVNKGKVPIEATKEIEWPAHLNCPHHWVVNYKGGKVDCSKLWVGTTIVEFLELIS